MKKSLLVCLFLSFFLNLNSWYDHLVTGTACNNYFQYELAIKHLNLAIEEEPNNKEAYRERAISYFELNHLELALQDYRKVKHLGNPIKMYSAANNVLSLSSTTDFALGLVEGVLRGCNDGVWGFLYSIRGSMQALWAFGCAPIEVSTELINALQEIGTYLSDFDVGDFLEGSLPELIECKRCWNNWSERTQGVKIGYIIGKYSVGVFSYLGGRQGVYLFTELKRANMMATLERCSLGKGAKILQESSNYAAKNVPLVKKMQQGRIVPHNANVAAHMLTKKHNWDKFIKITGNTETDCKALITFLEKENILSCKRELDYSFLTIKTYKYRKQIGKDTVVAVFEINSQNMPFLRNAWIETMPPLGR